MTIDTLFNTSWTVLIAVTGFWWIVFAALLLHQRSSAAIDIRERLEGLAGRLPGISSPAALVDRWVELLRQVDLQFEIRQNYEVRLVGLKWFLGGLLITGLTILLIQLVTFSSDPPPTEIMHTARLLSKASLITSGVIFGATLVAGVTFDASRAIHELANPGRHLKRSENTDND